VRRYSLLTIPALTLLLGAAVLGAIVALRALHAFHGMFG
jgi:hypothetical protein